MGVQQRSRRFWWASALVVCFLGLNSLGNAQGPFSAQIQQALQAFLVTPHTWSGQQVFKVGTGAGTMKPSGVVCQDMTNPDTQTQNAWNYKTCTVPAAALSAVGDQIVCLWGFRLATNANTKTIQLYSNGGTCSGSGGSACATGDQVFSYGQSGSATRVGGTVFITKASAGAQAAYALSNLDTTISTDSVPGTATESSAIPVVLAYRNTSAAAATTNTNIAPTLVCRVSDF